MNEENDLISGVEFNNNFYRIYELSEDNRDYAGVVSESRKGMYTESAKTVKKILDFGSEK